MLDIILLIKLSDYTVPNTRSTESSKKYKNNIKIYLKNDRNIDCP